MRRSRLEHKQALMKERREKFRAKPGRKPTFKAFVVKRKKIKLVKVREKKIKAPKVKAEPAPKPKLEPMVLVVAPKIEPLFDEPRVRAVEKRISRLSGPNISDVTIQFRKVVIPERRRVEVRAVPDDRLLDWYPLCSKQCPAYQRVRQGRAA